jgi:hypothetical protein
MSMDSGLCLWTAATIGSIVYPPVDIWVPKATVEWYWQGNNEELGGKPVPVPLYPPQIPHGLTRALTRASAARWHCLPYLTHAFIFQCEGTTQSDILPTFKMDAWQRCVNRVFRKFGLEVEHFLLVTFREWSSRSFLKNRYGYHYTTPFCGLVWIPDSMRRGVTAEYCLESGRQLQDARLWITCTALCPAYPHTGVNRV